MQWFSRSLQKMKGRFLSSRTWLVKEIVPKLSEEDCQEPVDQIEAPKSLASEDLFHKEILSIFTFRKTDTSRQVWALAKGEICEVPGCLGEFYFHTDMGGFMVVGISNSPAVYCLGLTNPCRSPSSDLRELLQLRSQTGLSYRYVQEKAADTYCCLRRLHFLVWDLEQMGVNVAVVEAKQKDLCIIGCTAMSGIYD